jgi:hypothetical protein
LLFGDEEATSVAVINPSLLEGQTPAHPVGKVDVTVENPDGQTGILASGYSYVTTDPPPVVIEIGPDSGPESGGTLVQVTGTGFVPGARLFLGGDEATSVVVVSSSLLRGLTPAHPAGVVDVTVENPDAQTGTLPGGFTYEAVVPPPTVTDVYPATGPYSGGTLVQVSGAYFVPGARLYLGGEEATSVVVISANLITGDTPPHAPGVVDVTVENPDGQTGTLPGGFTYETTASPPTVTAIIPSSGPEAGGTAVQVTGSDFLPGARLFLGGEEAISVVVISSSLLEGQTPAHAAGAVDVTVENPDGQTGTLAGGFTYVTTNPPPTVTEIIPASGPEIGGTTVQVAGTDFLPGARLFLGGEEATSVVVITASLLQGSTPPHPAGVADVTVENPDGQTGTLPGGFTYVTPAPPPTVTAIIPSSGPEGGGTAVQVTGADFVAGAQLFLGGEEAISVTVISSSLLEGQTPAHAAGVVDVMVVNPDAQTGTLPGGFTYLNLTDIPSEPTLRFSLGPNVPNPFRQKTAISFVIPEASGERARVHLAIYGLDGGRCRTLIDQVAEPGHQEVSWDGRDHGGNPLPAGIYFCRLSWRGEHLVRKLLLMP